ncbi:MAG: cytochrome C peroxidase [Bacteroidetes bacterium]|nr:cytochrome C peroxidase [Bacteroidota bacterium]
MKRQFTILFVISLCIIALLSFKTTSDNDTYIATYSSYIVQAISTQKAIISYLDSANLGSEKDVANLKDRINRARLSLKAADFWLRYLEPTAYKKLNGPLPVEWETEVFEKFEKPYKREGAGLTLAALYFDEEHPSKDSLRNMVLASINTLPTYSTDSITNELKTYHHFFLCNRLYVLNLAAIYTTGFECPETAQVIPELKQMMKDVQNIYAAFNTSYPSTPLSKEYLELYQKTISFVSEQPSDYTKFDHYTFIKDYINPLFGMNQRQILQYHVISHSMVDYSLTKTCNSIFNKSVYNGQNAKGIFIRMDDSAALAELDALGKLLFYDPILSGNNKRSCASCHNPKQYFTDTAVATALQFDHTNFLPRNTPTLINAQFNHLIMLDGKHITLQDQTKAVITSPVEMGSKEQDIIDKVLSCKEYREGFRKLLKYTPQEKEITFSHIASAITYYYSRFSKFYAPFDNAMNNESQLSVEAKSGFNIFMSKAQCATCHFVPQFNGVKPPYIGSEFEVLGVPADTSYKSLSNDKGRYLVNPAMETANAFRTGTIRNTAYTKPYMHNGVFKSLEQVIDFYDAGGGTGHGLKVDNQTLSSDSLKLTKPEKQQLLAFINSLNENIRFESAPERLPESKNKALNNRKVGGEY